METKDHDFYRLSKANFIEKSYSESLENSSQLDFCLSLKQPANEVYNELFLNELEVYQLADFLSFAIAREVTQSSELPLGERIKVQEIPHDFPPAKIGMILSESLTIAIEVASFTDQKSYVKLTATEDQAIDYYLSAIEAEQLRTSLLSLFTKTQENPPELVAPLVIGLVEASSEDNILLWIEVAIERAILDKDAPRLMINVFPRTNALDDWHSTTSWLFNEEAVSVRDYLQDILSHSLDMMSQQTVLSWLTIRSTDVALPYFVHLGFSIDLEGSYDSIFLTRTATSYLQQHLETALSVQKSLPARFLPHDDG